MYRESLYKLCLYKCLYKLLYSNILEIIKLYHILITYNMCFKFSNLTHICFLHMQSH